MLTPREAEERIFGTIRVLKPEDCPIGEAHGRVLRCDVHADRDLPPFDRVTRDGYALRAGSLAAGVRRFRVEAVQAAGMKQASLGPGADACVEIMTGAVLPAGADCVVPYEETGREATSMTINGRADFASGHAIHRQGSDRRRGEVLLGAGGRLTGREIAVAAACGRATLPVGRLPSVAVATTGDELVDVASAAAPEQIRSSNDHALRASLIAAGLPRVERFRLRDVRREIEHMLWHILAEYDAVVLVGGVSKGRFDYVPSELERLGVKKIFQGVAQRPGRPLWFGQSARGTPVFALPGNPVSAFTCLHRYVIPALWRASGLIPEAPRLAALSRPAVGEPGFSTFLPVALASGPRGELLADPMPGNTSGDFAGLIGTDGFLELPSDGVAFPAGTLAPFRPWL